MYLIIQGFDAKEMITWYTDLYINSHYNDRMCGFGICQGDELWILLNYMMVMSCGFARCEGESAIILRKRCADLEFLDFISMCRSRVPRFYQYMQI